MYDSTCTLIITLLPRKIKINKVLNPFKYEKKRYDRNV